MITINSSILFLFFLIFFIGEINADSELTGRINIMDSFSPAAGPHPYIFWFTPNDQTSPYRLNPQSLPSNILDFAGEQVKITMKLNTHVPLASSINPSKQFMDVLTLDKVKAPAQSNPSEIPPIVRSVTLLNKFNNIPTIPKESDGITIHNQTYYQKRFYDDPDSLKNYYLISSYGKFLWSGNVSDWQTLPKNQLDYDFNFDLMVADSLEIHEGAVDFCNPTPVTNLILIFNGKIDQAGAAFGSLGTWYNQMTGAWPTLDGCSITVSVSWEPDTGNFCCGLTLDNAIGVTAHELGHNQGFQHTPPPPGNWLGNIRDPYHDPWSVMSSNRDKVGPSSVIAGLRDKVGWMAEENKITVVGGTSSTITLDYLNEPENGPNPQMIKVPISNGENYIIEGHTDGIFDDTPLDNEGVLLYKFFPNGNQYSYLTIQNGIDKSAQFSLVATAGTESEFQFDHANLDVGEVFNDLTNNFTVKTLSKTNSTVTVLVSNNVPCVPPYSGTWIIEYSCTMSVNTTAYENVIVGNGAILEIPSGISLDIDFIENNLIIESGSGVLIKSEGEIK